MLQEHLEAAERHVAQGREHIAHQCELIAELERDGHHQAAAKAASMLETYMELQGLHEEDRDRLLLVKIRPQPRIELGRNGIGSRQSIADLE